MMAKKGRGMAVAIVVIVLAGAAALLWRSAPPENPETPEEAIRVIASRHFQSLDPDQQQIHVEKAFSEKSKKGPSAFDALTTSQRVRLKENMAAYQARSWTRRIEAYHALPPAEKTAYLDQLITEEEQKRIEKASAQDHSPKSGDGGKASGASEKWKSAKDESAAGWLKQSIESTSPDERARSLEFKKALRDRREQRGLESW